MPCGDYLLDECSYRLFETVPAGTIGGAVVDEFARRELLYRNLSRMRQSARILSDRGAPDWHELCHCATVGRIVGLALREEASLNGWHGN